ncbi:MAG TPA: isoprenyl transferase [Candidatus Sumerlaeota bacterium]|nr:MAG: Ditrans,polycis-undecaprenyl-diphosphate synthase ((2E,6E)-farnesyl-diphosphate specific) [candidate division BRC1 bacterium ADurb.Bin183]HOE62955.1 isoprenyl transferase [Candidatus Sumerlaeota bacterium]HRR31764.1 isoprenyl transferase [Candidatus Sumerlaeia bacterium]HON49616.1 isoprenyl transferase [Candidatus Sumerlaeota bacterium]HOR64768.1 isoprenyl transferase [Candidatus Sumerlaeota bacterium]
MGSPEQELLKKIDFDRLPQHVAIIMDGNGRWARRHGLRSRTQGHRAGIESVRAASRTAAELGMKALTLYAFSEENWSRSKTEVSTLMSLLRRFLKDEIPELMQNNIRLVASGRLFRLPDDCRRQLEETKRITGANSGLVLNLALSYGGRAEIVDAARQIAEETVSGRLKPKDIDEAAFTRRLYLPELPDPDLIIRTSGERRISNFLLWQAAYAEFHFTEVLWPDFRKRDFLLAILDYQQRERRFGKT